MRLFLIIVSAVLTIAAEPLYIIDTVRGKIKPERATWLIFSVLGVIAFYGQVRLGATSTLVFSGLDTLASFVVLGLSLKHGVGGFTLLDKYGLSVATIGLLISLLAHRPLAALLGVILADAAGMVLTVIKTYKHPATEPYLSWIFFATAALCAVFTVRQFTLGILLYPVYLVIANYSIPLVKAFSPHKKN